MIKYITPRTVAIAVLSIAVIVLIIVVTSAKPKVVDNQAALDILKAQVKQIQAEKEQLKREAEEHRKQDSMREVEYTAQKIKDYNTIQQLKTKRDEKIKNIDSPAFGSDSIRGAFSDL